MQSSFNPDHFILLTADEMSDLVTAENRQEFEPELSAFLDATDRLGPLRKLSLPGRGHEWSFPRIVMDDNERFVDQAGEIRGHRKFVPLPARPGEPQLALSFEWFWSEFCRFLQAQGVWAGRNEFQLYCIVPQARTFSLEQGWSRFWQKLSEKRHIQKSVRVFLDNKTLFKQQAKPWDSSDIPVLSHDMADFLIHYYRFGASKNRHFKKAGIPKAIKDLEKVIEKENFATIPLPAEPAGDFFPGGDYNLGSKQISCASCGEPVYKKDALERKAVFLKDSDERPQSAVDKDKLSRYCKRCIATVFLCPVKLTAETLTVKFGQPDPFMENAAQTELKKYVAQTLHVNAGSYVSLHISEWVDRKPLNQVWGAYHYCLWKMAVTFPPALFAKNFTVQVFPGEERFTLPQWALWFVSSLAEWEPAFEKIHFSAKDKRIPFAQFLRLVSRKKIFQAFYVLIASRVVNPGYDRSWKMNALQEIWSRFEQILNSTAKPLEKKQKEENMPIPDYPKIAGFAGLLLPLADRVRSSKKKDEDRKIAIGKLLEEVDRPIQYAYTAARESGSTDFIFVKRASNRFFFEKALELLQYAGEDIETLKQEAEKKVAELVAKGDSWEWLNQPGEKLFLCSDQIARVTAALVSERDKPYENEADWRAFAYQVKLALWSMFPSYLGSREKSEK